MFSSHWLESGNINEFKEDNVVYLSAFNSHCRSLQVDRFVYLIWGSRSKSKPTELLHFVKTAKIN